VTFTVHRTSRGAALVELNYKILGRTRLRIGGRFDDRWGQPKPSAMLAALLLQPQRAVPIDELVEWVWPDDRAPRDPQQTFYTYAKRIRQALCRMDEPAELVCSDGTYRIAVDHDEIDFFRFRRIMEQAKSTVRHGDQERVRRMILTALDLWGDRPLADLYGERATNWRLWALTEHWIPANDALLETLLVLGNHDEVLRRLADLPLEIQANLSLVKRRLEALHRQHRGTEATAHYCSMRKQLLADFNQDEADELARFYEELVRRSRSRQAPAMSGRAARVNGLPTGPNLLPHDISDFTGRDELIRHLDAALSASASEPPSGIIVLDGAPGIGKTALAVHWAHRVAERFPGGLLYVDLRGFAEGSKVEPTTAVDHFLVAFGLRIERIPTAAARASKLRSMVAGRRVLALLDNAKDSAAVQPLLDCLTTCLVVVTSRRALSGLGRRGAVNLQVPRLDEREGETWLARRVGMRANQEPDAVGALVSLCAGNPLALRVVGDHIGTRPQVQLREFVDELDDVHVLLGLGDDGDGPDSSVRKAFSWSFRDLKPDEQKAFRLLGLHPGPDISLEAAAAVFGQEQSYAKRNLDVLVHAHLVSQPESRGRYRVHDLLGAYASELAGAPERNTERSAAERRMLSFYLHTANNADRSVFPHQQGVDLVPLVDGVIPLKFVDDEAAMDWCLRERANLNSISSYAGWRGFHAYAAKLPGAAGEILQRLGFHHDVIAAQLIAMNSARIIGDLEAEADSRSNLGALYLRLGDFSSTEIYLTSAAEQYNQIDNTWGRAAVTHQMARLHVERGNLAGGIESNLSALAILQSIDARGPEVVVLSHLSEAHRRAKNLEAANSYCRDALWLAERLGDSRGQALSLSNLGGIYYDRGDFSTAKGYLTRALAINERVRDSALFGKIGNLLATIHRDEGDSHEAERYARLTIENCHNYRDYLGEAHAYDMLAQILHTRGRRQEAVDAWTTALPTFDDLADPRAAVVRARLADSATEPSHNGA
jgi:DNA-binding SARP family transcriptional activator/tetratricopeptide (TPR) repeat protein